MSRFRWMATAMVALLAISNGSPAEGQEVENPFLPRQSPPTLNDFGGIGLIQTPMARAAEDGQAYAGFSYVWPYSRYFITVQGLPWLEATLRYTSVANRFYGPEDFSGDQSYKDRGIDVKIRLLEGDATWPNVALGLRDIGGTGLFDGEYIVADQTAGDFDFSFGLGWGNLGNQNHFRNPFSLFSKKFKNRNETGDVGGLGTQFFRGDVALFGGVKWRTPFIEGLSLKMEYDPNDYKSEALQNSFKQSLPINIGMDYQPWDWLQVGAALERGNRAMVRFSTTMNFHTSKGPPKLDPVPPPLIPVTAQGQIQQANMPIAPQPGPQQAGTGESIRTGIGRQAAMDGLHLENLVRIGSEIHVTVAGTPVRDGVVVAHDIALRVLELAPDFQGRIRVTRIEHSLPWLVMEFDSTMLRNEFNMAAATIKPTHIDVTGQPPSEEDRAKLKAQLAKQGFHLFGADYKAGKATLFLSNARYRQIPRAVGRAVRTAASALPPEYGEIQIIFVENGIEMLSATMYRSDIERALAATGGSIEETWMRTRLERPSMDMEEASHPEPYGYPGFSWSLRPALRQTLGRPEAFILYQAWMRLYGTVTVAPGLNVTSGLGFNIYNNFDRMRLPSDSVLPHVRSDIRQYLQDGTTAMTHLQADYTFRVAQDTYNRVYGGYLEEMFGGVGNEILYKPFGKEWAIGLDVAWAKQRDTQQWFGFRDYNVVTGHLTGYYHYEPLGLDARVRVGRYLAGDKGATFELSRTFDSGITVGAFATFTDVSAEEFGEGRFDKGIYFSIPLDNIYVKSSRGGLGWLWRPLTRDGGQTLASRRALIGQVSTSDGAQLRRDWNTLLD
ncbi:YjbH domain-containing protein [Niveispirillum irakense]|uniref:YjbH domain-containing protein n=1 Tax=Niveispirillum irakense TaxID=34011 RepID=UPI000A018E97|nr:YjbH domain-containing protein [Niveispirillum irakense]